MTKKAGVLLLTFHKYRTVIRTAGMSRSNGARSGPLPAVNWPLVSGESKDSVTDWPARLRQLIGLAPDNESTHFTAMGEAGGCPAPRDCTGDWRRYHDRFLAENTRRGL